jgi:hypothetical protein
MSVELCYNNYKQRKICGGGGGPTRAPCIPQIEHLIT